MPEKDRRRALDRERLVCSAILGSMIFIVKSVSNKMENNLGEVRRGDT